MVSYEWTDPVVKAVREGNRGVLLKLINRGKSVNQPVRHADASLFSLLFLAVTGSEPGHLSVAALVLDRGKYTPSKLYSLTALSDHL